MGQTEVKIKCHRLQSKLRFNFATRVVFFHILVWKIGQCVNQTLKSSEGLNYQISQQLLDTNTKQISVA